MKREKAKKIPGVQSQQAMATAEKKEMIMDFHLKEKHITYSKNNNFFLKDAAIFLYLGC